MTELEHLDNERRKRLRAWAFQERRWRTPNRWLRHELQVIAAESRSGDSAKAAVYLVLIYFYLNILIR